MMLLHPAFLALSQAVTAAGGTQVATIFAILASAVIVLGGLAALVRAIWKTASILRDNTSATQGLTKRMDELSASVDGRFDKLVQRVDSISHELEGFEARFEERGRMIWKKADQ